MMQIDDVPRPSPRGLESVIGAVDADLPEAERIDEELLLLFNAANRQHDAKETAGGDVRTEMCGRPRPPAVIGFDDFVLQAGRVPHAQVLPREPFPDPVMLD